MGGNEGPPAAGGRQAGSPWEISQRERVASDSELDLKAWTAEQISAEAQRAYAEIWRERDAWGGESLGSLAEYVDQNNYPARIRGTQDARGPDIYQRKTVVREIYALRSRVRPGHSGGPLIDTTARTRSGAWMASHSDRAAPMEAPPKTARSIPSASSQSSMSSALRA